MPLPLTTLIVIRNNVADLAALTAVMERVGTEHGMPEKSLFQLQVALDELVSNLIKYAWPRQMRMTSRFASLRGMTVSKWRSSTTGGCSTRAMHPKRDKPPTGQRPRPGGVGSANDQAAR